MFFCEEINTQLLIINSFIRKFNEATIINNENYIIDDMSWERWLKVNYVKNNRIPFSIVFSPYEFKIEIDQAYEIIDIDFSDFIKNKKEIQNILDDLYSCFIIIKKYGNFITVIKFIDNNNQSVRKIKFFKFPSKLRFVLLETKYPPIRHF